MWLTPYFKRMFVWSIVSQMLLFVLCLAWAISIRGTSSLIEFVGVVYGVPIVNWYCDHYVANVKANIGAGLFIFIAIVPFFVFFYALAFAVIADLLHREKLKGKAEELQKSRSTEDVHCLRCGAVMDSKQELCQKCGWTWK